MARQIQTVQRVLGSAATYLLPWQKEANENDKHHANVDSP